MALFGMTLFQQKTTIVMMKSVGNGIFDLCIVAIKKSTIQWIFNKSVFYYYLLIKLRNSFLVSLSSRKTPPKAEVTV